MVRARHLGPSTAPYILGLLLLACGGNDATSPAGGETETDATASSADATTTTTTGSTSEGSTSTGDGSDGTTTGSTGATSSGETGSGSSSTGDEPPPDLPCPEGTGPAMVKPPRGYCIDATEVTRGQYDLWLQSEPSTEGQPAECSWNADFTPGCAWPPGSDTELPTACVDWCDAHAYCAAAGKRLCGKLGGGPNAFESFADADQSQWFDACSSGGANVFGYGNDLDPAACRGADEDMWAWIEVGSLASCQSAVPDYGGIYDLSGNVMEWEDSCDQSTGMDDNCRLRGGSFNNSGDGLRCDMGENLLFPRNGQYVGVGFRCCAH